jgi:hypothetical protein
MHSQTNFFVVVQKLRLEVEGEVPKGYCITLWSTFNL